ATSDEQAVAPPRVEPREPLAAPHSRGHLDIEADRRRPHVIRVDLRDRLEVVEGTGPDPYPRRLHAAIFPYGRTDVVTPPLRLGDVALGSAPTPDHSGSHSPSEARRQEVRSLR